jgi:hypothetical protein
MQPAQLRMKPLANYLLIAHDHGSDHRIGADTPPPALSQLQRPLKVG